MPADLVGIVVAGLVLVGLAATELYGYLLFHGLAEGFSVTVACGTFMVVWNARRFFENSYVTVIGIGLLFIGDRFPASSRLQGHGGVLGLSR